MMRSDDCQIPDADIMGVSIVTNTDDVVKESTFGELNRIECDEK